MPIAENVRLPLMGTGWRCSPKAAAGSPTPSTPLFLLPAQYAAPDPVTPQNPPLPAESDTNVGVSATMTGVVQVARAVSPMGPKLRSLQQYAAPDSKRPQVTGAPRPRLVNRCAPFTRSGVGLHRYGRPRVAQCSCAESLPSWPTGLPPQQYATPSLVRAHECPDPALTDTNLSGACAARMLACAGARRASAALNTNRLGAFMRGSPVQPLGAGAGRHRRSASPSRHLSPLRRPAGRAAVSKLAWTLRSLRSVQLLGAVQIAASQGLPCVAGLTV